MISRVIILESIIGDKERSKVESILRDNLRIEDINSLIVINEHLRDILIISDNDRSKAIEYLLNDVEVILECLDISLDIVLDKITRYGLDSLEEYEIKFLDGYK